MEALGQTQFLADDCHQCVDAHGDPDLSLHRVGRFAEEAQDAQVLFDPLEEDLHRPSTLVELGHDERGQLHVIGQVHKIAARLFVEVPNPSEHIGISLPTVKALQPNPLIGLNARGHVHRMRAQAGHPQVVLGADHEEGARLVQGVQAREVQVRTIHHVERARLDEDIVECIYIVLAALGDRHERRNRTAQIEQCVQFDGRLGAAKSCPRKQIQAQIDRSRIEDVSGRVQIDVERLALVEAPRSADQRLGQRSKNAPIAPLVCIRQRAAANGAAEAKVIEHIAAGIQAVDGIAQAGAIRQLGEAHAEELVPAGKVPAQLMRCKAGDAAIELLRMDDVHHLGKNRATLVHPSRINHCFSQKLKIQTSNRSHPLASAKIYSSTCCTNRMAV